MTEHDRGDALENRNQTSNRDDEVRNQRLARYTAAADEGWAMHTWNTSIAK